MPVQVASLEIECCHGLGHTPACEIDLQLDALFGAGAADALLDKLLAIWWPDNRMHTGMADNQASEDACILHLRL